LARTAEIRPDLADLESLAILEDPYPAYRALREADPVHLMPSGEWYLTRYDDVAAILTDKRFGREPPEGFHRLAYETRGKTAFDDMIADWMVFMDPPAHTRLRRLVSTWFVPERIEAMRPMIQALADELLDAITDGAMEVVSDFAYPLPVMVISAILGLPRDDHLSFRKCAQQMTKALDSSKEEDAVACEALVVAMQDYFRAQIADRRKRPRDDLIGRLAMEQAEDAGISEETQLGTCIFLLWAGHETTKNLISSSLLALLRNPGQMDALRRSPESIDSAVEEFLRFESPVQKVGRWTREEIDIGGKTVPKDRLVVGVIGAANRDAEKFPDPDRLDIARNDGGNLAFGRGAHFCIGSLLGRIEAQVAINTVLRRLPRFALGSEKPEWQDTLVIRGLKKLPVIVERA